MNVEGNDSYGMPTCRELVSLKDALAAAGSGRAGTGEATIAAAVEAARRCARILSTALVLRCLAFASDGLAALQHRANEAVTDTLVPQAGAGYCRTAHPGGGGPGAAHTPQGQVRLKCSALRSG